MKIWVSTFRITHLTHHLQSTVERYMLDVSVSKWIAVHWNSLGIKDCQHDILKEYYAGGGEMMIQKV